MSTLAEQEEYKEGYRDGMNASLTVARTVAEEDTATAGDVVVLLEVLASSSVIQPTTTEPPACPCGGGQFELAHAPWCNGRAR